MKPLVEPLSPSDEELDTERVIEIDTEVATLWLERDAQILTPTVVEGRRWEPQVTDLMTRVLKPGMTFVDAGANIGYLSVHASKLVGAAGRVLCVEPDPRNISILRANLLRNGCTNASVLPVAAWFERAELSLRLVPEGGACSHVVSGGPSECLVSGYRLDELVSGTVDYLKVDCEGTDHLVLSGAAGLFRANPDLLATVEFVAGRHSHTGDSARDILRIYEEMRLRPYLIRDGGRLQPVSYPRLKASGADDRLVSFDFALSPRRPTALVLAYLFDGPRRWLERLLKVGGDLLEHVPARVRPRIRRRDRRDGD